MRFQKTPILILAIIALFVGSATGGYFLLRKDDTGSQVEATTKTKVAEKAPLKKAEPIKEKAKATESNQTGQGALTWALAISLCCSVFMTLYLLRWRLRLPNGQVSLVPDELLKIIGTQHDAFVGNTKALKHFADNTNEHQKITHQQFAELQQAFSIFQTSLSSKDQEIERHKKGYDFYVYKKFVNKFIKFYIDLKREADAPENQHSAKILNDMLALYEDALSECNVAIIMPDIAKGADEQSSIISANRKSEFTSNSATAGKIAKVIYPAFVLKTPSGTEILREASVSVYSTEQSEAA